MKTNAYAQKHRTASFSTLSLSDYEESPQATAQLLQWSNQLSHFHFGSFYNNRFYMDLPMFHSMLLMHKDTLKTIDIGYLSSSGRGRLFNASDFPRLEVLRLSRWEMEENLEFSSTEADLLLAPNLKTFGWDFSIYDQHSESWTDFGKREERWVRELARAAIERKAALKKIEWLACRERQPVTIVFNGDFHWFDAEPEWFAAIEKGVARHRAIRGNVETEIARAGDIGAGCGCAYPESVDAGVVTRSNEILADLRQAASGTIMATHLAALPMHLVARVGNKRIGIVHGDAASLAGWRFAHDALDDPANSAWLDDVRAKSTIDIFASTHTCLAALRDFDLPSGHLAIVNNGSAGMANFAGTTYGLVSRIATTPSPESLQPSTPPPPTTCTSENPPRPSSTPPSSPSPCSAPQSSSSKNWTQPRSIASPKRSSQSERSSHPSTTGSSSPP